MVSRQQTTTQIEHYDNLERALHYLDCNKEFPKSWFRSAKLSKVKDININFFQVDASLPLKEWVAKGWIFSEDPRGWFRYWLSKLLSLLSVLNC